MGMGGGFLQRWGDAHRRGRNRGYRGGGHGRWPAPAALPSVFGAWGNGSSFSNNQAPRPSNSPLPNNGGPNPSPNPAPNPYQAPYASNLENNLPLAQGWQRPTAMPTAISSIITNQLYQSRQNPLDVWGNIFGVNRSSNQAFTGGTSYGSYGGSGGTDNRGTGVGGASGTSNLQQSTYDALQLADAYFSPKRLELAYQLGDMETDMRRLAVNLGRQIDDPVLQAKLYKEAMQNVRSLDAEQTSFALQMVDQRRKEELQNTQFYDQLALERDKMTLQDQQFYAQLSSQEHIARMSQSQTAGG